MAEIQHYKLLDGLRGLAAQPVLLSHSYALAFSSGLDSPPVFIGWLARLSVIIFFVLSGFVISAGIVGEIRQTKKFNWIDYSIRRVARIYPPYLVAIAFVAMIMIFVGVKERNLNTDIWAWVRSFLFLFTGADAVTITPVWWLRLEVGLYVFAALAAVTYLAAGRLQIILFSVGMALFAAYCWRLAFGGLGAALFAAGALAAIFLDRLMKIRPLWICILVVATLALPIAWPALVDDSPVSMIYQSGLGVPLALALVAMAHVKTVSKSWYARFAMASGGWSYTLYIIHVPVVIALTSTIPLASGNIQRLATLLICMLVANLVAIVVARIVERPKFFAKLIRRALMREETPADKAASVPVALENSTSS